MERIQLKFSAAKLLALGIACLGIGAAAAGLGLDAPGEALARRAGLLLAGLLSGTVGLAALIRLSGDRTAAMIRPDGIRFRGLFFSRDIPWEALDRLSLRESGVAARIAAGSQGRSHGVSTRLLEAGKDQADRWVKDALAARYGALTPRPEAAAPPPAAPIRIGAFRRVA